jgi:hypothetical protein
MKGAMPELQKLTPLAVNNIQNRGIDFRRAYRALIKGYITASIRCEFQEAIPSQSKQAAHKSYLGSKGERLHGNKAYLPSNPTE